MYEIRLCKSDEYSKIQEFIHNIWKNNHILAREKLILDWQHLNQIDETYNFIVAYNTLTDKFDAVMGFIPIYHFDRSLIRQNDFWLALWKTDDINCTRKGLGADLLLYFKKKFNPNSIGVVGINTTVERIYKIIGFKTGVMSHYYIVNPNMSSYKILKLNDPKLFTNNKSSYNLRLIENIDDISFVKIDQFPEKTKEYYINRFYKHPSYKYCFYGIFKNDHLVNIFITRKIDTYGSSCIRIVDIIGAIDNLSSIQSELIELLGKENAEYIDCYNFGIKEESFFKIGFLKRDETVIIPNYFEPFEQKNVDIRFAYLCDKEDYIIFKADGDQDRPS